jgi:hypothetical protein
MMSPPSRIHHADRRNPLTPPAKPKSDSPAEALAVFKSIEGVIKRLLLSDDTTKIVDRPNSMCK